MKKTATLPVHCRNMIFDIAVLGCLLAFLLLHLSPGLLTLDTMAVGGDTPAHNYLVSHLREQLFEHGRIVSWSHDWWCGFPMFQFYFCGPYLLMALLGCVMPLNIAFKLVSVAGILALPTAAYASARIFKLPRPVPILCAIAMVPFLMTTTHTRWGVNAYSTLAGMIANSISFPLMLIFIAMAFKDSVEGVFRLRTSLLLAVLVATHFFTTIIAMLTICILPVLRPAGARKKACMVLAAETGLGLLLMAWWLVPLVARIEYSVDFGTDWNVRLHEPFPAFALWLMPLAAIALYCAARSKATAVQLIAWMLLVSSAIFTLGTTLSPVFVNVRLWPFVFFALLALEAIGLGLLLEQRKGAELLVLAVAALALTIATPTPEALLKWSKFNYEGLERKAHYDVFAELVEPLSGTPGRLAADYHSDNDLLGSERIFEAVPHLVDKPILDGGIINSAAGSLYAQYVQTETSDSPAGWPELVEPSSFNMAAATEHMELLNVKHFIARSERVQSWLRESDKWQLLKSVKGWELYELMTHDGSYVSIPDHYPVVVTTRLWQRVGLEWIYEPSAVKHPFILLKPGTPAPPLLHEHTGDLVNKAGAVITDEHVSDNKISFRTTGLGLPHIIKCNYYPNWQLRKGAKHLYMVTPCFMLLYPESEEVELIYDRTAPDYLGIALSLCAMSAMVCFIVPVLRKRWKAA